MRFAHPVFLLLFLFFPLILNHLKKRRIKGRIIYSGVKTISSIVSKEKRQIKNLPLFLRCAAISLLIVALARPQTGKGEEEISTNGIDIILAMDISGSMSTSDIEPTRLDGAKEVAARFIKKRRSDRIGIVLFAGNSFTYSPLTLDYGVLDNLIRHVEIGMTEDGTAIGMAIATAVNRLRESKAKSRIIILLTDGVNNRGSIDPKTAAKLAGAVGIKVYTIGVGKDGTAYQIVDDPVFGKHKVAVRTVIDEEILQMIASDTGAHYYRATNIEELQKIYDAIDKLEKVEIKSRYFVNYTEHFNYFLYPALFLLFMEFFLSQTIFRRIP